VRILLHLLEPLPLLASECLPRLGILCASSHSDLPENLAPGPSSVRRRRRGSMEANAVLHWHVPCGGSKSCDKRLLCVHVLPCDRISWRMTPLLQLGLPLAPAPQRRLRVQEQPQCKTTGEDASLV
jgi:hypothetical protein